MYIKHITKSIFIVIFVTIVLFFKTINSLPISFKMDSLEKFKIREIYQNDKNIFRSLMANGKTLINLELYSNLDPVQAETIQNSRIFQIKNIFEKKMTAYPGEISSNLECDKKYLPQFQQITSRGGVSVTYFVSFLNDRYQAGACNDDLVKYHGVTAYFYCQKSQKWYQLSLFSDQQTDQFQDLLNSISCN